jgi:aspartate carbamoyltransferase catalytic subunit
MNLISINDLTPDQIGDIIIGGPRSPRVPGSAILLFAEPSTRTRVSFELAAELDNIKTIYLDPIASSLSKGESLYDTFKTLAEYRPDYLIVRHKNGTACQIAESIFDKHTTIISAGTGTTNHPTQALADARVIHNHWHLRERPRVAIVGDVVHSRVARSLMQIGSKLGWTVGLFGPPEFTPSHGMDGDFTVFHGLEELPNFDFVYVLRPQLERLEDDMFNKDNYISHWRICSLSPNQYLMHAGPVNRGVEVTSGVLESSFSLVQEQVSAGLMIRRTLYGWLKANG